MKCDMHVHTVHSGMCTIPVLDRIARESYADPRELYDVLKRRGMDLVTVTDHDSIDAAEALRHHPDFFLSEEVTATAPSGTELHVGVYDINERQHIQVQRRRRDLLSLVAYLNEQRLFFTVNHLFSGLTGRRTETDFALFAKMFPGMETRNGQMLDAANRAAEQFAAEFNRAPVGGSDAHAVASAGTTWTEAPCSRSKREFLAAVARGHGRALGESGSVGKLTRDVFSITVAAMSERPWLFSIAPLVAVTIPCWTVANALLERRFAGQWARALPSAPRQETFWPVREILPEVAA